MDAIALGLETNVLLCISVVGAFCLLVLVKFLSVGHIALWGVLLVSNL